MIQVPTEALGSLRVPADHWLLPRCWVSAPTEETGVPELDCRCCWIVTDGILIRLLWVASLKSCVEGNLEERLGPSPTGIREL